MSLESGELGEAYLTAAEVARRLDCSVSLVQKWRRLGWLPATRLGPPASPVYGYLPSDVEHFAATRWNRRRGRPPGTTQEKTNDSAAAVSPQPSPAKPTPPAKVVVHAIPPVYETSSARNTNPSATTSPGAADPKAYPVRPATYDTTLNPSGPRSSTQPPQSPVAQGMGSSGGESAAQRGNFMPTKPPLAPRTAAAPPRPLGATGAAGTPASHRPEAMPARTGRPLILWDADPRQGTAIILARFPAADFDTALATATAWSRRYPTIALGEAPTAATPPTVLALWQDGTRKPVAGSR